MSKWLFIVLTLLILGFAGYFIAKGYLDNQKEIQKLITLTIWGTQDEEASINYAALAYKNLHPNITVKFVPQSLQNYRTRVQTQIANGNGPDIFMLHNTWTSMFLQAGSIAPAPTSIITTKEFSDTFYPVIVKNFSGQNSVYALPRKIDGLALYVNEDILKAQGISVPTLWDAFVNDATRMTVIDQKGVLTTAGAAIGTPSNIDYWSDILGLLFAQQPNAKITNPNTPEGKEVINFFTSFIKDDKKRTWDESFENSTKAFADGKLAFYFAPADKLKVINSLNPNLHFKTVPVPQLPDSKETSWGTFWGYSVSSKSKEQKESWKFIKFLTTPEAEKALFAEEKQLTGFGYPYARKDLQKDLANDPYLGAFVNQAPNYVSWYMSDQTMDQGINEAMQNTYAAALNKIEKNSDASEITTELTPSIATVLAKYGLAAN